MARLGTVRFLSAVRAVAARCKRCPPLDRSCRHHEVGRGQEQWSPQLPAPRPPLPAPPRTPAAPPPTPRSLRPPRPAPAFPHPWWRGSPVPPARTSHPPRGPGSSTGLSLSQSPSVPPPFIHTIWMGILTIRRSLKRRCTRVTVKSPIKQMAAYFRILCKYVSNIICTNRSQNGNIAA